jgi:hypothetical protein
MNKIILLGIAASLQFSIISGQCFEKKEIKDNKKILSGTLSSDSRLSFENSLNVLSQPQNNNVESKKSPYLAAALSFVIPGAGELYDESYIKTAVFAAIEATAITVGLMYNKKGNNQTNFFQNYADQNWSAYRYANWTLTNIKTLNPSLDPANYSGLLNSTTHTINWAILNKLEVDVAGNGQQVTGSYYSHQLPPHGEQQYYELIGKYSQYNVGWDDFGDDPTKPFVYDQTRSNLTPNFKYYSVERGKANDYYNVASKAVLVVVANHIISAIDAAWTAARFNKNLDVHTSLEKYDNGFNVVYYPQLNIQFSF